MNRWILRAGNAAKVMSLALCIGMAILPQRAGAAPISGADTVRGFYDTLLSTMRSGPELGASGRYAKLAPVVERVFDVPLMSRLAIGPTWATLSEAQR